MELHLKIVGFLLMALAFGHVFIPGYFNWKRELTSLSLFNQQVLYVHTFFIALTVFLMGLLCVTSAHDLVHTVMGQRICTGLSVFWGIRLCFQFFVYSPQLWRGKTFETIVHLFFSMAWAYFTAVFIGVIFYRG